MAELDAQLRLDIDQALRDIDQIETALDRALASIELRVDTATARREIDTLEDQVRRTFDDVQLDIDPGSTAQVEQNLAGVERNIRQAEDEAEDLTREFRRAEDAAADIDVATRGLASSFGGIRTAAAGVAGAIAAIGGAAVLGAAIRGANTAIQAYAELADSVNAVNVVFREGAGVVLAFGQQAAQSAGLSEQAFNQAVAPIGAVLTNFGFSAREAAEAATVLVQRGADLASVYGGSVNDAVLAITSALVGQVEPLRRFGGEISQARVEAFALASGLLQAGQELDTATAVQARYGLILKDTAVVQGDFLNTADDLANAQRIFTAETQNLVSSIGEQLAPVLETILQQAPDLLNFFGGLAVSVGATAAAATEAGGPLSDLARNVSAVVLGLGQAGDVGAGIFDVLQFGAKVLQGDLAGANEQFDQFDDRIGGSTIRIASQSITDSLSTGGDALDAFANSIAFLGRQDDSFQTIQQSYGRLAATAGLSGRPLRDVTKFLLDNAEAASLNADEIAFLRNQLALLTNALDPNVEALRQQAYEARNSAAAAAEAALLNHDFFLSLEEIGVAAEEAGLSMLDLLAGVDPVARGLFDALSNSDQMKLALQAIGTDAGTAAVALDTLLRPAIINASDALIDFNDNGKVSLNEFIRGIGEATVTALQFQSDLAAIFAISPEVARELLELPTDVAAELARAFVENPAKIEIAEDELIDPVGVARNVQQLVLQAIELARSGASPQQIAAFTAFVTQLDVPGGTEAVSTAIQSMTDNSFDNLIAPDFTPVIVEAVEGAKKAELQTAAQDTVGFAFEGIDLSAQGLLAGQSYIVGLMDGLSGSTGELRLTLGKAIDAASNAQSPPKLFLDKGAEAGEAYWSGFEQADLSLRVPTPAFSGSIQSGSIPAGTGGGGSVVNFNLPALDTRDADVTIARAGQIGGQVVGILNSKFFL